MPSSRLVVASVLLQLTSVAFGHGHDDDTSMDMGGMTTGNSSVDAQPVNPFAYLYDLPSYAGLSDYSIHLLVHVALMVVAWLFVLPLGVMFSISRSRLALPTQLFFLLVNGCGVMFGTIYNVKTPDLYEHNAHHKIGWLATWIMTVQAVMSLLFLYSGRTKTGLAVANERAARLAASVEAMAQHNIRPYSDYRWSGDSGQGTERSSMHTSRDMSPTDPGRRDDCYPKLEPDLEEEDDHNEVSEGEGFLRNTVVNKYLARRVPGIVSKRLLQALETVHNAIDRTILLLGFIAFTTGGVAYFGIFRSGNVLNGLAHFIKGGIFFWYGLLTLGRWMGCFAEFGWAWNVRPNRSEVDQWKASIPSAECIESFVIFLYGITNVFLEHLAGWGSAWTAEDLEHVSISVMFLGGGLCGMLIESTKIREWLNTTISVLPVRPDLHESDGQDLRASPKTYRFSMNPLPALIILLLGVMMSSHHQSSMVSTMVHAQWGTLLCGFAVARGITYVITYISPPTSVFASRPPSELVSSFCLISGGVIFMFSAKDCIHLMETSNLNAMFLFTVMMGFSAFIMAWEILTLALRGWAAQREISAAQY